MLYRHPEPRRLSISVLWVLFLLLTGCSIVPKVRLDNNSLHQLPRQHEITNTPFFSQDAYQCGPAALATVLTYYGHERQPQQLSPWLFTPDAKGSFPTELDAVTRKEGFVAYPLNDMDSLLTEVAANHPVLVLQNLGTDWLRRWHFAVVVGYDLDKREVILRSGTLQRRVTPIDVFDKTWSRSERWGRVILPPTRLPASVQTELYLRVVSDLEQTGPAHAAEQAYATALNRWPTERLAWFGLANVQLKQQHYDSALQSYQHLLTLEPGLAPAWNNLAYALRGLDCPEAAKRAVHCALQLAPGREDLIDSAKEINTLSGTDAAHCPLLVCPYPLPAQ